MLERNGKADDPEARFVVGEVAALILCSCPEDEVLFLFWCSPSPDMGGDEKNVCELDDGPPEKGDECCDRELDEDELVCARVDPGSYECPWLDTPATAPWLWDECP